MSLTFDNIIEQLVISVPEFREIHAEHNDYYKTTLPHILFGDLVRFTREVYRSSLESDEKFTHAQDILKRTLDFIERAANSEDEGVVELVQVSFMENMHQLGESYNAISSKLGPKSEELLIASQW